MLLSLCRGLIFARFLCLNNSNRLNTTFLILYFSCGTWTFFSHSNWVSLLFTWSSFMVSAELISWTSFGLSFLTSLGLRLAIGQPIWLWVFQCSIRWYKMRLLRMKLIGWDEIWKWGNFKSWTEPMMFCWFNYINCNYWLAILVLVLPVVTII